MNTTQINGRDIIYFRGAPSNEKEYLSVIAVQEEIVEIESVPGQVISRTSEESMDLVLNYGNTLNGLPHKYKEKVLKGESFEIEVIERKYITYVNNSAQKED